MDEPLARYYAHMFTYKPVFIPTDPIESNFEKTSYIEAEVIII